MTILHRITSGVLSVFLAWSILAPSRVIAERIDDPTLHFSLTVPPDFKPDPQVVAAKTSFMYAFRKEGTSGADTVVIVERMGGTLGRDHMTLKQMPPGFKGRLLTVRWKNFDIDAVEVPEQASGVSMINYNAQVPLKPEAIQLRVLGPADQSQQLRDLLNQLLGNLSGESNWLSSSASAALANSPHYGTLLLSLAGIAVVGGIVLLIVIRRHTPRGTVLVLAIILYAVGRGFGELQTRESKMIAGTLEMLGCVGFIFGIVDAARKRRNAAKLQAPPLNS